MEIKRNKKKYKLLVILWWIIFLLIICLGLYINRNHQGFLINTIKTAILRWGIWGPVVFIFFYQIRVIFLFPISLLATLAGTIWGLTGLIYVLMALALCATIEFIIARYFLRDKIENLLRGNMNIINDKIGKNEFLSVFFIRLVPNLMFDIQNCALAVTKIKYRDYIAGTMLGMLSGTFALVFFGDSMINILLRIK